MGRIGREVMFMMMARAASMRSTCFRRNVGAVVVHNNNPVSAGWNGQEPGAQHCTGNDCPGIVPGMCGTLHAEHNAMRVAVGLLLPGDSVDLYSTDAPCPECCLLIRNSALHVERIYFEVPYRDMSALKGLQAYPDPEHPDRVRRTEVYEITPAGYIVEHFSRRVLELP